MKEPSLDVFKGILIFLVVLGHNDLATQTFPRVHHSLYMFHVACFLLLPLITSCRSQASVKDLCVRYLVPHYTFFLIICLVYYICYVPHDIAMSSAWGIRVIQAAVLNEEYHLKEACGFRYFWFLPALLAINLLARGWQRLQQRHRWLLLAPVVGAHATVGLLPDSLMFTSPWSLPLIVHLFPLGLAAAHLHKTVRKHPLHALPVCLLFGVCLLLAAQLNWYTGYAGTCLHLPDITDPLRLVFHDVTLVSAFVTVMLVSRITWLKPFILLGRHSLLIFLTHALWWQLLVMCNILPWLARFPPFVSIGSTFIWCLGGGLASSILVTSSSRLKQLIFPRTWRQWTSLNPRHSRAS